MFSVDGGEPLAIVRGGLSDGQIIFTKDEEDKQSVIKRKPGLDCKVIDGKFEQIPSSKVRVLYIAGPSGAGKSVYSAAYIKKYLAVNPDAKFHIFSRLTEDPALDNIKPQHRVMINETLLTEPIEIEDFEEGCIVLFDDIDNIADKKLQLAINKIKEQILELGRHKNIKIVCTSHLINPNEKSASRTILNEMQSLTIFPKSGSHYQIKYALKHQMGLSGKQMQKILNMNSRWVTVFKVYPQCILTEHEAIMAKDL